MTDQTTPADAYARATARRQLQALGLTEQQSVALLLPVIAETYREVADDAADGAHGGMWGETVPEALTEFAAAYRKLAADCDLPGAPLPEATRALTRERAAHEEHRRSLASLFNLDAAADWLKVAAAAAKLRRDLDELATRVADYENRINWETTCGKHAQLLDACQAADDRADRIGQMADAWEQRFPDTIRTAAAVEAVRTALGGANRHAALERTDRP